MYDEPCKEEPCSRCEFRNYDSFHNELWCGHKPKPEGIGNRLLIGEWGTCEFWKKEEYE